MPIGSTYNGNAIDAIANADLKSGDPVIVGSYKGFANTDALKDESLSVRLAGATLATVAGTLTQGAPVFVNSGTMVADKAVKVTLSTAEGTSSKALFGIVYALGQESGTALVTPVQGIGTGAGA